MKVLIVLLLFTSTLSWANPKEIRVLVVDSGTDISHNEIRRHVNMANWNKEEYFDALGHGTHVSGLVLDGTCDEVELVACKFYLTNSSDKDNMTRSIECFKKALNKHIDIINYSAGGKSFNIDEFEVLKALSDKGVKIVVAAGNNGEDLTKGEYYPAQYKLKNLIAVGNLDGETRNLGSNYNLADMVWEKGTNIYSTLPKNSFGSMTGTSQSAAIRTNKMLKELCEKK